MAKSKRILGNEAIELIEKALNLSLPPDCEVELRIRDYKAVKGGKSQVVRATLSREAGVAKSFDVRRLVGALSDAHRS